MANAPTDHSKRFENLFKKEVLPHVQDEIKAVELVKEKQQSLASRFKQNEEELVSLNKDLLSLRTESVEHVMSDGKSEEYIRKMSKIKGRTAMLNDAQEEITKYLSPNVEEQLDNAYKNLVAAINPRTAILANLVREEIFNTVQEIVQKTEGYHTALHSMARKTLALPVIRHKVSFENIPSFPGLDAIVKSGRWWEEK